MLLALVAVGKNQAIHEDFFEIYVFILCGCSWLWEIFKGHINSTLLLKQCEVKS